MTCPKARNVLGKGWRVRANRVYGGFPGLAAPGGCRVLVVFEDGAARTNRLFYGPQSFKGPFSKGGCARKGMFLSAATNAWFLRRTEEVGILRPAESPVSCGLLRKAGFFGAREALRSFGPRRRPRSRGARRTPGYCGPQRTLDICVARRMSGLLGPQNRFPAALAESCYFLASENHIPGLLGPRLFCWDGPGHRGPRNSFLCWVGP